MTANLLAVLSVVGVLAGGFAAVYYPVHARLARTRAEHRRRELREIIDTAVTEKLTHVMEKIDADHRETVKVASDLTELRVHMAKETGGNSGGMRQAINQLGSEMAELRGEVREHLRFNDHG